MMLDTPYYVVRKDKLDESVASLKDAMKTYWNNYIVGYSYKTNALPWVIEYFKNQGFYAEVVSDDEYLLAKHIGVQSNKIIYNGPIKTKETMLEAIQNGCIVNLDANREIEWLSSLDCPNGFKVGIRVNFDIEKMCPGQSSSGENGGRFGFCYENGELYKAITKIKSAGGRIAGLHLHVSSKTRSLDIYKAIAKTACSVIKEYGLDLDYIDVGGGYFGGMPGKPNFNDYMKQFSEILKEVTDPKRTALIVEPGMSVIGPNIDFVTSIIDVKETTYGFFVVTDGSRTQIDPLMKKTSYSYEVLYKDEMAEERDTVGKQTVCGYTCMEGDRLFDLLDGKRLAVGDVIKYSKVGAYTMCLTPLFIKYFPAVYVDDGEKIIKVRVKWHPEYFCQGSEI